MKNIELKERFIDERNGIEYIRKGDYYFPNLIDSASVKANELGKYGKLRLKYLLEHKKIEYTILWVENKLRRYVSSKCRQFFYLLILILKCHCFQHFI